MARLTKEQIDAQVTRMLQPAEEAEGPDNMDYVDVMRALAVEANMRADRFICHQDCDECGINGDDGDLAFVATGYKDAIPERWLCADCARAASSTPMTRKEIRQLMSDVVADGNGTHDDWQIELDEALGFAREFGDDYAITVYCTPDHEAHRGSKGTIEICIVDDGGAVLESDSIEWSFEGRTSRGFFDAVRPYLSAWARYAHAHVDDMRVQGDWCDACPTVGANTDDDADRAIALNPAGGAL